MPSTPDPAPAGWGDPVPAVPEGAVSPEASPEPQPVALIVDDDPSVRRAIHRLLVRKGFRCRQAASYREAVAEIRNGGPLDLALLDFCLPGGTGFQLLPEIRALERWVEVLMISGHQDLEVVRQCLREGAFDYLVKPFSPAELSEAVDRAMERRRLVEANQGYRRWLEGRVAQQTEQLRSARDVAVLTLAELAEARDPETGRHLERIARFCGLLCELLQRGPYAARLSPDLVENVCRSSKLHDIGKVAIPDAILLKPGPLTLDEFTVMRTHATIGGDILRRVRDVAGGGSDFLEVGMEIAYQHHEKWDGTGYPAGLAGERIGLPGRIVTLVDAYDALTSRRPYQDAVDHAIAVARLAHDRGRHFDPVIFDAFVGDHREFDRIRARLAD